MCNAAFLENAKYVNLQSLFSSVTI
jgi:hypothetical protein